MALFTRQQKVARLAAVGDVAGLCEALADAARHGSARAEEIAAIASVLVDLGEDGIAALLDLVVNDPDHVQFGWIQDETFHRAACPQSVAQLSGVLRRHPDTMERVVACTLLRRLDTSLADEAFAQAVTDRDPHVRLAAARGLADHGDGRGQRALVDWAAHADDPVPGLIGLARLADLRVIPTLERLRDARHDARLAAEFDRTIRDIQAAQARVRDPGPVTRLEGIRDRLRSIEVVDGVKNPPAGSCAATASRQIPAICDAIDSAVAALRAGDDTDGRHVTAAAVGRRLAALVAEVSGPELATLMGSVLEPRGVRMFQGEVAELDVVATSLQERGPLRDHAWGRAGREAQGRGQGRAGSTVT